MWARELDVLRDMGFTDTAVLLPILQKHVGIPTSLCPEREVCPMSFGTPPPRFIDAPAVLPISYHAPSSCSPFTPTLAYRFLHPLPPSLTYPSYPSPPVSPAPLPRLPPSVTPPCHIHPPPPLSPGPALRLSLALPLTHPLLSLPYLPPPLSHTPPPPFVTRASPAPKACSASSLISSAPP